ncbi:MAG: TIGR03620 family F420-dependent LLM class oxidoreductase [Nocardiopsaceae bacterium]|nr:TIGR03620 family F420-dependent LLM class oxidoreductase [Nocardiopsaceae bacterium]
MTTNEELRSRLRRVGIWMPPPAVTGQAPETVGQAIEKAGFTSVWVGGGNAKPADFAALRGLLAGSERLIAAPGIASIWAWQPADIRETAGRLASDFPGRFVLGLGVSHPPLVAQLGQQYARPLAKMEKFLDELDHPADHRGAGSWELPPVVLAALGPKMLELSARYAGAHPYFTTPDHTARAREILGHAPLLVPEQAVSMATDLAAGRAAGRGYAGMYLKLPNYTRNLKDYGFTDDDIADGGSDRLIDAIIPSGPVAVASRVREHLDAGADHVVVQPLAGDGGFALDQLGGLADALAGLLR